MMNGTVVGIVLDNRDPDGMHRVKVQYPVDLGVEVTWCRMMTPMAGSARGLVMLPDIGTEVLIGFAYRTLTAYILGGLYNGAEDKAEPYRNDDKKDNKRVFWSRNDHLLIFDDSPGAEKVSIGAKAPTRLQIKSAPIYHDLDAANKKITEYCAGTTFYQGKERVSFKCSSFKLKATDVLLDTGDTAALAGSKVQVKAGSIVRVTSPDTELKTPLSAPKPIAADDHLPPMHTPRRT
jgi:uncharacterized protein involved in type VI secretion and phage assembly